MKRKVVNILLCIAALAPVLLSGCRSAKLSDADEQYARGEYHAAMLTYKKIYNKLTPWRMLPPPQHGSQCLGCLSQRLAL